MFSLYWEYYVMGIILLPGLLFAIYAQAKVSRSYSVYRQVSSRAGRTAAEIARSLLDTAGCEDIKIVKVSGTLTDHYHPKKKVVALSQDVYNSTSVAAIGIAAHEVGHAIQYKNSYFPAKLRNFLIPITNFASVLLWPLVIIGLLLNFGVETATSTGDIFLWVGVIIFGGAVLVNLVTLPVEFNASRRAIKIIEGGNYLDQEEVVGAKSVLNAAALTYVAALLVAMLNLLRFILVFSNRRR